MYIFNMNQRRIIRTDFWVQSILFGGTVVSLVIWLRLGSPNEVICLSAFLLLLSWQFFSGIFIAAELGRWYRGALPICLLLALVLSILLLAAGLPTGVFAAFGLAPIIALTNFAVGFADYRQYGRHLFYQKFGDERILDSGDLF